jgi:glutamate-1-semialdehyde aminotransferase
MKKKINIKKIYNDAKKIIPGGTQLFSKRAELYHPDSWPTYYSEAKGINIKSLDNKNYKDFCNMSVGASILGYCDDYVDKKVIQSIKKSVVTTLNNYDEVKLAKELCKIHPWAKKVKFCRAGGEAVTMAIRIARGYSEKSKILFCGYHGWHDWYLAANLKNKKSLNNFLIPGLSPYGVPRELRGTALPFKYNDLNMLNKLIKKNKNKIAAIVMEPQRDIEPKNNFLKKIRTLCTKNRIILIFDEITSGFRMCYGGLHLKHKVNPDIAVFAKGMSNGFAMAAVIGNNKSMKTADQMFISSTSWTEKVGVSAALATLKKLKNKKVSKHLINIGKKYKLGLIKISKKRDIPIVVKGLDSIPSFEFRFEEYDNKSFMTLFTALMMKEGILANNQFRPSYAHKNKDLSFFLQKVDKVFRKFKVLISEKKIQKALSKKTIDGFSRLNS